MGVLPYLLAAAGAYLVGSIPTGYLVARARGTNIRQVGSGNIGATNVFRVLGPRAGALVLAVDFLKGLLPCLFAAWWTADLGSAAANAGSAQAGPIQIVAGIFAILGHNYTCWLGFRGGKGIATSAGVLVALVPKALLIALGIWLLVFVLWRFISLASMVAAAALPLATALTGAERERVWVTAALGALAILRHHANIRRLLTKTEPRFEWRKRPDAP